MLCQNERAVGNDHTRCCVCYGNSWKPTDREDIVECSFCSIRRRGEFPTFEAMESHYDEEYMEKLSELVTPEAIQSRLSHMARACVLGYPSILEFGCSDGWLLEALQKMNREVAGIELNRAALKRMAAKNIPAATEAKYLPDRKWDLVMSWHFLEHFPDPDSIIKQQCELSRGAVFAHVPTNHLEYPNKDHLWHFQEDHLIRIFKRYCAWLFLFNDHYNLWNTPTQAKVTTIVGIVSADNVPETMYYTK